MPLKPPFTPADINGPVCAAARSTAESKKGTTLVKPSSVSLIDIVYREKFQVGLVWEITADISGWAESERDSWPEATRTVTLTKRQRFVQIESVKDAKKVSYVLGEDKTTGARVWFRPNEGPKAKRPQIQNWWPQWGLRGDMTFKTCPKAGGTEPIEKEFKMLTVWERWKKDQKRWTEGMMTLGPGIFAGYVKAMPAHSSDDERKKYPSIWVIWQWDEANNKWLEGVYRVKNPTNTERVTGVFIHPGYTPSYFLGCLSPGSKEAEWGFEDEDDPRKAMWQILNDVGVTLSNFKTDPSANEAKWFLIRVTDPDNATGGSPKPPLPKLTELFFAKEPASWDPNTWEQVSNGSITVVGSLDSPVSADITNAAYPVEISTEYGKKFKINLTELDDTRQKIRWTPDWDEAAAALQVVAPEGTYVSCDMTGDVDSKAFENAMASAGKGPALTGARGVGADQSAPAANFAFLAAGGAQKIKAKSGDVESQWRLLKYEASYFYHSGHGHHSTGKITLADGDNGPKDTGLPWWTQMKVCIIAGCSVLDCGEAPWEPEVAVVGPGGAVGMAANPDPPPSGLDWKGTGAALYLGYSSTAPGDAGGVPGQLVNDWVGKLGAGTGTAREWCELNLAAKANFACAVEPAASRYTWISSTVDVPTGLHSTHRFGAKIKERSI